MKIEINNDELKRLIKLYFKETENIDVEVNIGSDITVNAPVTFADRKYTASEYINLNVLETIFSYFDTNNELKSVRLKTHNVSYRPDDDGYKTISGVTVEIGRDLVKKRQLIKGVK